MLSIILCFLDYLLVFSRLSEKIFSPWLFFFKTNAERTSMTGKGSHVHRGKRSPWFLCRCPGILPMCSCQPETPVYHRIATTAVYTAIAIYTLEGMLGMSQVMI